jgi:ATP-dependent exoDNAse (exonuclease V) beta subunit
MFNDSEEKNNAIMSHNIAQRLALNIDSHIVVDAGAGTGKTRTIIDRVIEHYLSADQRATRILPKPDRPSKLESGLISAEPKNRIDLEDHKGLLPSEVVLLTFTTKAADEIRDRLRKKLVNLSLGSKYDDGKNMTDPRILRAGLSEQFLYLLEDAPILL